MKQKTQNQMERINQEERFIKWAEARDDDWWENGGGAISIWDFRIMQDFIQEELSQQKEEWITELEGMKDKYYPDEDMEYTYNKALSDAIKKLKEEKK